jgi:hypothetical protein
MSTQLLVELALLLLHGQVTVFHPPFLDRLQPFADQAGYHSILHPTAQKFLHLSMIDSVEKLAQIHLKNPLNFLRKALFSQVFQR